MQKRKGKSPKRRGKGSKFSDENLYNMGVKLSNLKYGGNVAQSLQNLDLTKLNQLQKSNLLSTPNDRYFSIFTLK